MQSGRACPVVPIPGAVGVLNSPKTGVMFLGEECWRMVSCPLSFLKNWRPSAFVAPPSSREKVRFLFVPVPAGMASTGRFRGPAGQRIAEIVIWRPNVMVDKSLEQI